MNMVKPKNWPINMAEEKIEMISNALDDFLKTPGYIKKEALISLVSEYDLNSNPFLGVVRFSDYEVEKINEIYYICQLIALSSPRCYLYKYIGSRARIYKMNMQAMMVVGEKNESVLINEYAEGLILPLKLYYFAYVRYNLDKDKSFTEKIIEVVKEMIDSELYGCDTDGGKKNLFIVASSYINMLTDLSHFQGNKDEEFWKFDRDELSSLFSLEIRLIKLSGQDVTESSLWGTIILQMSNFILKSRHGYNQDFICKYLPENVAEQSYSNHEIWLRRIEDLNDDREGKVLEELFYGDQWSTPSWVNKPNLKPIRNYYVSSFAKSVNDDHMKENYGPIVFGYKNDSIGDLISPLFAVNNQFNKRKMVRFTQVVSFDVLYDKNEAREELEYLFSLIDMFDLDDERKNAFLQEILQYWILSIKDKDWSIEQERRYVLFLYDEYNYMEMKVENNFLKIKTPLFLFPDFLIGDYCNKIGVQRKIYKKRHFISSNNFLFCEDCLNSDYDSIIGANTPQRCAICGSKKVKILHNRYY